MFKHVLIPTDGSPVAAKAVKAGLELAKEINASDFKAAWSTLSPCVKTHIESFGR